MSTIRSVGLLLGCCAASVCAAEPFALHDGDRVALVGSTLVERETAYGDWELALTAACADRGMTFRNLGWSGDTVWGESRGYFDPPEKGYQNLLELVGELQPTVIFVAYGFNESFAGPAHTAGFREGLNRLLDDLERTTSRLVLITPPPGEDVGGGRFAAETLRPQLEPYVEVIRHVAARRRLPVVDLFAAVDRRAPEPLTDNGIHFNAAGYRHSADVLCRALGLAPQGAWLASAESAQLRAAIRHKNELFFHRWRPQNQTYLFGFRKHEQGQNAKEVAQFDPLIAEQERTIDQLRRKLSGP
jgi:lysophospholipase L1-like esterase